MLIGELARQADVSIDTIRFYQKEGLVSPIALRDSGYREFDKESIERLRFIIRAKRLGFSLQEIKDLLVLKDDPDTTCNSVRSLTQQKLEDVSIKIKSLKKIEKELRALMQSCDKGSADLKECPIVDALEGKET